ncbi:hypothetical protein GCM10025857_35270 [Alicyclobacillus contaminans]|uniref:tRNA (adenine(22)-N(1))-methyltransferase n=1 Tax=Alicyclobacillus contaminans TaxID=392016 RepID=UPI0003FAD52E|nr:class I SAM-dependent methyltransferase [Alicyclobacillus contaminans]GMA52170.1 hypothetical protein GCM10025857_35270 [Alicyclobacillus contaminans]
MTIVLSHRLQWLADRVHGPSVADIGTDHALLPIYLIQSGRCTSAIASDVAAGPCRSAAENVQRYGLRRVISVRQGNGLATIRPGEVDTVVIAGMGGATASEILRACPEVVDTLGRVLIQPMNASGAVRQWLLDAGFTLKEEAVVTEEGRFYEVLSAERGTAPDAAYERYRGHPEEMRFAVHYGPFLLTADDAVTRAYFQQLWKKLREQLQQVRQGTSASALRRAEDLEAHMAFIARWHPVG